MKARIEIRIDGGRGVGKTTLAKHIVGYLKGQGFTEIRTEELDREMADKITAWKEVK